MNRFSSNAVFPAWTGVAVAVLCVWLAPTARAAARDSAKVGSAPAGMEFRDLAGKTHSLLAPEDLPAVYLFLSTECPVANSYSPRIVALAKQFSARHVRVYGIYPNGVDDRKRVAAHALDRKYTFPIVKEDGTLAAALGAEAVPEAVVLDAHGTIRYRGRIDDNEDSTRVRRHDLRDAVAAVLAGRNVVHPETTVVGCVIQPGAPDPIRRGVKLTYARDIAPIVSANCISCHRSGAVAPFSLTDPKTAVLWAKQMKIVTAGRRMPPWKADSQGEFRNERRLTADQIAKIGAWADSGAPLGDTTKLAALPPQPVGWKLGEPDDTVGLVEPYHVAADGSDVYRCFVIPTSYPEDRYLSGMEFRPGNPAVVHHVIAYLDTSGRARKLDAADPGPGYTTHGGGPGFVPAGWLGGWAPGNEPGQLPDGVGIYVPKGADIVLELHYHKNGKAETDQTRVGLHFARKPVDKRLRMMAVVNPFLQIPAGDSNYEVRASGTVNQNVTVLAVMPHMHLLGRRMAVDATEPAGTVHKLVNVPDWDFNWQTTYEFRQPLRLPANSTVSLVAAYDNSTGNPHNPNTPPKTVHWGEQTTDEMCIAFVAYTVDSEALTKGIVASRASMYELGAGPRRRRAAAE